MVQAMAPLRLLLPRYPLQLFARATLIKQDNLLSNPRAARYDGIFATEPGRNCRSRVHILMIHVRSRFRSLAENIIQRTLRERKREEKDRRD